MTGIQALEGAHPDQLMKPGVPARLEHEYIRHGTQCLIANVEVATGHVLSSTVGSTRSEADFTAHIERTLETDPTAASSSPWTGA